MERNLTIRKSILITACLMAAACHCFSQSLPEKKDTAYGFMIYLRPGWIFQPCADSSRKLLDALDSTSFIPGSYSRSFGVYQLPLEGKIGKSFIGEFRNNIDGRLVRDTVYYFYARFVMNVQPGVDTVRMREICWYTLYDDTETYQLGCTLRDNEIEYIEPFRKEDQRNYIDFLNERNYPLPEWAQ